MLVRQIWVSVELLRNPGERICFESNGFGCNGVGLND